MVVLMFVFWVIIAVLAWQLTSMKDEIKEVVEVKAENKRLAASDANLRMLHEKQAEVIREYRSQLQDQKNINVALQSAAKKISDNLTKANVENAKLSGLVAFIIENTEDSKILKIIKDEQDSFESNAV